MASRAAVGVTAVLVLACPDHRVAAALASEEAREKCARPLPRSAGARRLDLVPGLLVDQSRMGVLVPGVPACADAQVGLSGEEVSEDRVRPLPLLPLHHPGKL